MEKDIFNIIEAKDYDQLTTEEREMIVEFCENEDEYHQMKHVLLGVNDMNSTSNETPRKETKDKLDDLFAAQSFPKAAPIWYNKIGVILYPRDKKMYQRPLFQLAAILILILGILPFLMNSNKPFQKEQLAKNEMIESEKEIDKNEDSSNLQEVLLDEARTEDVEQKKLLLDKEQEGPAKVNFDLDEDIIAQPVRSKSSDFKDVNLEITSSTISRSAASQHPDGIFMSDKATAKPNYSIALSEQAEVLDLLTATF